MLIDIHTHKDYTNSPSLSIKNLMIRIDDKFDLQNNLYYSIGIHPWYIDEGQIPNQIDVLSSYAEKQNIIAIGETGLDKEKGPSMIVQEKIFRFHAGLSEKLGKPLIIHCVGSFNEIIKLKKQIKPKQSWIIHGYRNNNQIAEQLIKNKFKLSLGHSILTNDKYNTLISDILNNNDFFFETDEAEISILSKLYNNVANLKSISVEELEKQQMANFEKTFKVKIHE